MATSRTGTAQYKRAREELRRRRLPCHICGLPIDYTASADDPNSFQADHEVAVARGGDPNGRLLPAHRSCNRAKSDRDHAPIVRRSRTLT